jgi:polysaccharide biosynthesis/export protein
VDDIVAVNILQPEPLSTTVSVSPDGSITVPYIGSVVVKGQTIVQVQETVRKRLADGYMKYPVVSVTLQQSRSRRYFLYGEVVKPGTYPLDESTTVLRAISMAGGFTKFGSSSRVKVLRPRKGQAGYETIKVNIKALMDGSAQEDIPLQNEDIVVVSEGVF